MGTSRTPQGAWIEMQLQSQPRHRHWVAPHTGVWIEIMRSWRQRIRWNVAPNTGAWIEIDRLY